jgi:hypothetical protein
METDQLVLWVQVVENNTSMKKIGSIIMCVLIGIDLFLCIEGVLESNFGKSYAFGIISLLGIAGLYKMNSD